MQSNNSTTTPVCYYIIDPHSILYNHISLGPSLAIILILSILHKRVRRRDCCNGRPGVVIPFNFLTGNDKNRVAIACTFGSLTGSIWNVFVKGLSSGTYTNISVPIWARVFLGYLDALEIGIIYYPIFACLETPHTVIGSIAGLIYTLYRFVLTTVRTFGIRCPVGGTIDDEMVTWFFFYLPNLISLGYVIYTFARRLWNSLKNIYVTENEHIIVKPYQIQYVTDILRTKEDSRRNRGWFHRFCYTKNDGFQYSTQFVSSVTVILILLYQMSIPLIMISMTAVAISKDLAKAITATLQSNNTDTFKIKVLAGKTFDVMFVSLPVSHGISLFVTLLTLFHMCVSHRKKVLKLWKGDKNFLPATLPSPKEMVGYSLRYMGYHIAFSIWGFIVLLFVVWLFMVSIWIVIELALFFHKVKEMIMKGLQLFLSVGLVPVIMLIFQLVSVYYIFRDRSLDDNGGIYVDNSRAYHIVLYYLFFLNICIGLFSSLLRSVKGLVLSLLCLGRIDRCAIVEGFHIFDSGYMAYLGFLHVQCTYRNPILRCFCDILLTSRNQKIITTPFVHASSYWFVPQGDASILGIELERPRISPVAFNRWFLALTLLNNPGLRQYRKQGRLYDEQGSSKEEHDIRTNIAPLISNDSEPLLSFV